MVMALPGVVVRQVPDETVALVGPTAEAKAVLGAAEPMEELRAARLEAVTALVAAREEATLETAWVEPLVTWERRSVALAVP